MKRKVLLSVGVYYAIGATLVFTGVIVTEPQNRFMNILLWPIAVFRR